MPRQRLRALKLRAHAARGPRVGRGLDPTRTGEAALVAQLCTLSYRVAVGGRVSMGRARHRTVALVALCPAGISAAHAEASARRPSGAISCCMPAAGTEQKDTR
ncbi:hypothetical protein MRX96_032242 [Rhipicephalus microplus]